MRHTLALGILATTYVLLLSQDSLVQYGRGCEAPKDRLASDKSRSSILKSDRSLTFEPRTCRADTKTLGFAMGYVRLSVLGHVGNQCVFDYLINIEQGTRTYRCRVPVTTHDVTIEVSAKNVHSPDDIKTSFDLKQCEVVTPDAPFFVSHDVAVGKGPSAGPGRKVRIRYSTFIDDTFSQRPKDFPEGRTMEFDFGSKSIGDLIQRGVQDMRVGGKRQLSLSRSRVTGIDDKLSSGSAHPVVYLEIELLSVKEPGKAKIISFAPGAARDGKGSLIFGNFTVDNQ